MDHDFTPELIAHTDPAGATWLVSITTIPELYQENGKTTQWTVFNGYLQPVKTSLVSNTKCAQDRSRRWLLKHWREEDIQPVTQDPIEAVNTWAAAEDNEEPHLSPLRQLASSIYENLAKAA